MLLEPRTRHGTMHHVLDRGTFSTAIAEKIEEGLGVVFSESSGWAAWASQRAEKRMLETRGRRREGIRVVDTALACCERNCGGS